MHNVPHLPRTRKPPDDHRGIHMNWLETYVNNVTELIFAAAYSAMDDALVLKKRGYIVGSHLGEGSYAKVKSAYSERLKFDVAVKIINRKKAPRDFLEKFLPREIDILTKVHHRSIIKTYEIFETLDGKIYIVMELGTHGDLLDFIKTKGAMPEEIARKMFRQLCSAIKYCHDVNIVHRDLKCENLLLDKDYHIKLSDFGFAKRLACDEEGRVVHSKTFCGSAAYAAPEVLQGIPYDPKIYDIWSLGVILYIIVCGSMPYDSSNVRKMLQLQKEHRVHFPSSKNLTTECKDLIYRMLHPDVTRRLRIEEALSHIWMQPARARGVSIASLLARNEESSWTAGEQKPEHKADSETTYELEIKPTKLEAVEGSTELTEKQDNINQLAAKFQEAEF